MNRRDFLVTSVTATTTLALGTRAASPAVPGPAIDLLRELIRADDAQIPALLARQERTPGHRWLGGLTNIYGTHTVESTSGFISGLTCAACAPGSSYFNSPDLIEPLRRAFAFLFVAQYADGTVDNFSTNFHSNPDTAFIIEAVAPAYALLRASKASAVSSPPSKPTGSPATRS